MGYLFPLFLILKTRRSSRRSIRSISRRWTGVDEWGGSWYNGGMVKEELRSVQKCPGNIKGPIKSLRLHNFTVTDASKTLMTYGYDFHLDHLNPGESKKTGSFKIFDSLTSKMTFYTVLIFILTVIMAVFTIIRK